MRFQVAKTRRARKARAGTGGLQDFLFGVAMQGYFEDDDVSLQDLIRRERIEGVQARLTSPCRSESSRVWHIPLSSLWRTMMPI